MVVVETERRVEGRGGETKPTVCLLLLLLMEPLLFLLLLLLPLPLLRKNRGAAALLRVCIITVGVGRWGKRRRGG